MTTPRHVARILCLFLVFAASSGCRIIVGLVESDPETDPAVDAGDDPDAAAQVDAYLGPDADMNCTSWSFTPAHIDPCSAPAPAGMLTLTAGTWTYDTNSGALTDPNEDVSFPASELATQSGGPELRVLSVDRFDVEENAELFLVGKRPLLVLSWSTANVNGLISATSSIMGEGAGANPPSCPADPPSAGAPDTEGAGGGGGGGFGETGGAGGTGNDGVAAAGVAGPSVSLPQVIRGGCGGAEGGNATGGTAGAGGGAFHITARDAIDVAGTLVSGGQGGGGAQGGRGGGGGAGSGGMVGLEAPSITVTAEAVIAANGGGGGGGCDNNPASPGEDGQPSATAAVAGKKEGMGGDGGDGGIAGTGAEPGKSVRRGGGGGGGGVGFVLLSGATQSVDSAAIVSPTPTVL